MAVPDRMKDLVELLNNAARAYYNEDTEIMSNLEYDRLYDELLALEAGSGVVLAGSPTQKVGFGVVEGLRKVAHETPLLSLDKTKNVSKLESFLTDGEGILSWKLDGLTVVLTYENGEMIRALTRGNGVIGEEVTHNARVFRNIPLKVGFKGAFAVRGEAVITYSDFERINAELIGAEKYKNPRNLCSGAVRQLNSGVAAGRGVRYIAYTVLRADGADFGDKKENQLGWLASLGFETVEYKVVTRHNIHEWVQWFESRIPESDTPSDGLVLTMNGMDYSRSLGSTSKFPRDSIAFKWADEESETTLLGIEWNTSRTGLINPVAVFEPVEIEGTTVERASLHNVSVLRGLGLGVGDRITVYKANMIIPQVSGNLTRSGAAVIPERCPVCGGPAELDSQAGVEFLRCPNPNCPAQLLRSLAHFASRDAMNIEGLSEQTLEKFIGRGFVSNYADIYGLGKYEAEITQMDGFGAKSFGKLMKAVEKSRSAALPNLINALGIPQVGLANAKLLCDHFRHDIERIMALGPEELIAELDGVRGFGGVISRSVANYFANPENAALLRRLLPLLEIKKPAYIDAYYGLRDIDGLPGAGAAG
ncbi:MAG: NAD-dependent DNA ligase LigA, partial [Firmicutes bacterium]|nr:NAD-dependent DNA ligase LigA [Bacillota bacterium]